MKRALIIVDLQNDFLPQGALGVLKGDEIVPVINSLMNNFDTILTTQDWHPKNHVSFASTWGKAIGSQVLVGGKEQTLWPVHCLQNSYGSDFPAALEVQKVSERFHKGEDKEVDSYSAFFDQQGRQATSIDAYLKKNEVQDVYIVGLATDYCVKYTVLDALKLGYRVYVIVNGCRAVNLKEGDEEKALSEMRRQGAFLIQSTDLIERPLNA